MGNSGGKLVLTDQTISDIVQSSGQSRSQVEPGVSFLLLGGRSAPTVLKGVKYAGPNNRVNHQLHHICRWNHNAKHFLRTTQQDS